LSRTTQAVARFSGLAVQNTFLWEEDLSFYFVFETNLWSQQNFGGQKMLSGQQHFSCSSLLSMCLERSTPQTHHSSKECKMEYKRNWTEGRHASKLVTHLYKFATKCISFCMLLWWMQCK